MNHIAHIVLLWSKRLIPAFKETLNGILFVVLRVSHWEEKIELISVALIDAKDQIYPLVDILSYVLRLELLSHDPRQIE